jgi:tRNA (guanine37-N1)-methyltransferase
MKYLIITLFPEMFEGPLSASILKRAKEKSLLDFEFLNLRDFGLGKRKQVDDTPYGGGAGMVLRVDVMANAIKKAKSLLPKSKVVLLTPQGDLFNHQIAKNIASKEKSLILICGHYEGFDERIRNLVDQEISIGEYVLTGGEIPAMVLIDSISRLIPGVLGAGESLDSESFTDGHLLEYPHYTRPEDFDGIKVPAVLKNGNHAEIAKWRKEKASEKTKNKLEKDSKDC